jgi:hypothetical protein
MRSPIKSSFSLLPSELNIRRILQPPVLLGVPTVKLDLEPQRIALDQGLVGQGQVIAGQQHLGAPPYTKQAMPKSDPASFNAARMPLWNGDSPSSLRFLLALPLGLPRHGFFFIIRPSAHFP